MQSTAIQAHVIPDTEDNRERGVFYSAEKNIPALEIITPVKGSKTSTRHISLPYTYIVDAEFNPEGITILSTRRTVIIQGDNLHVLFRAIHRRRLARVKQARKGETCPDHEPRPHTIRIETIA